MMIFYQVRSHYHSTIDLSNETCTSCGNRGTLKMFLMQKYIWLYGPILPSAKYDIIKCSFCESKLPNTQWNKELDALYHQEKKALKTPFRMWRGAILMLLLFIIPFTLLKLNIIKPAELKLASAVTNSKMPIVQDAKVGDVLFISINQHTNNSFRKAYHTLAKVIKIEEDKTTIKMYSNKFSYTDQYNLKVSNLDDSKFSEELEIQTGPLKKKGNLRYYNAPTEKYDFVGFGNASTILQE